MLMIGIGPFYVLLVTATFCLRYLGLLLEIFFAVRLVVVVVVVVGVPNDISSLL